jgi:ActR/RegA family two-component response regulator
LMAKDHRTVLIALRKEHKRYALRMCWGFEQRGLNTKLVSDVPSLLAAEREFAPVAIILDAAITQPKTTEVLKNLSDRLSGGLHLVLVDLSADEERDVRERWPGVDVVV